MDTTKHIQQLHFITNQWAPVKIEEQIEMACSAGCKWVQLRVKEFSEKAWKSLAVSAKSICNTYNAILIINDNVNIAKKVDAHGVHLGQHDTPPASARGILGQNFIIGGTANTSNQIQDLAEQNVDYIGLGPFGFTSTKKNLSPVLGIDGLKKITNSCKSNNIHIPIIGIGGVEPEHITEILSTGVYGVALSSAISNSKNSNDTVKKILKTIKSYNNASIKNS